MLAPRWRKVWRDLWSNKTRTLIVLLSIAVGVTAIGMVMGAQAIVDENLPAAYAAVNPASGTVYALTTFDDEMVESIRNMDEVAEAEGLRYVSVRFRDKAGDWRSLQLFAIPDFDEITINKLKPQEGAYPPGERSLLLERASFSAALGLGDFQIGDTLLIEPPDGKARELTISGSVHDMSQLPAFLNGAGYGYIDYDTLEWLGEDTDYNQLVFVVAENKFSYEHVQNVGKLIEDRLERSNVTVLFTLIFQPGEHPAQSFLNGFSLILGAVGLLSLGLSSFLIVNTLSAIMTQQVRQIGIMKAIGARTSQITGMYFVMVLGFGLLALVIAIPLGAVGAVGLASLFGGLLNFDVGSVQLNLRVVLIQVAIGLAAPLLAAILPIWRGVHVTVREAISDVGLGKGRFGRGLLDRFIVMLRYVIPMDRPAQISLRNTFRRKARLTLTLITLSLASTIFIAIFSIRASLQQTLDDALRFFDYDVQIIFDRSYRADRLVRQVAELPGVDEVETWGFGTVRRLRPDGTESDSIIAYAPRADSTMIQPSMAEGRWLRLDDQHQVVINTDVLRNEKDIGVGSSITLDIGGKEREVEVVGVTRGTLTGPNIFFNFDGFARMTNAVGRAQISLVRLEDRSPANQTTMGSTLESSYRDSGFRVQQMGTISQVRTIISSIFNVIIGFLLFMALLLGFVGGLGLMGTMSINVLERTREIGVMRAIGASDRAVLRIVLVEGVLIGLISWIIGGLIALPASRLLTNAVGQTLLQAAPSYIFSTGGAILWLVTVIVLSLLASFLPARGASRLTVREVLSYQ
jgi:putative ABC transport system permease protein